MFINIYFFMGAFLALLGPGCSGLRYRFGPLRGLPSRILHIPTPLDFIQPPLNEFFPTKYEFD